jgi:hypothetical protein
LVLLAWRKLKQGLGVYIEGSYGSSLLSDRAFSAACEFTCRCFVSHMKRGQKCAEAVLPAMLNIVLYILIDHISNAWRASRVHGQGQFHASLFWRCVRFTKNVPDLQHVHVTPWKWQPCFFVPSRSGFATSTSWHWSSTDKKIKNKIQVLSKILI